MTTVTFVTIDDNVTICDNVCHRLTLSFYKLENYYDLIFKN